MGRGLELTLQRGEEAWAAAEFEDALALAEEALRLSPDALEAWDLKANALAELGRWEDADQAFAHVLLHGPQDTATLLAAADVKIRQPGDDRERIEEGLALVARAWPRARADEVLSIEASLLRGVAAVLLGDAEAALDAFAQVLQLDPEHHEARLEQAQAWFELGRSEEAWQALSRLAREFPEEPTAHHTLGLIAERRGQPAAPHFERARALAPEDFPPPLHLGREEFDAAVARAIDALPPQAREHLGNVVISVEPIPGDEELREGLSPTILGVFSGTPVDERSPLDPGAHQTARITLFQNNLERFAANRAELEEEIRITVLHEVGHLLGLDEDELYERGLD
jgi:predicted Zn-dependent protease with MMP-like domain/Flp pilus assembly protein TadD